MRLLIARTAAELDRLEPVWTYLHAQSPAATIFQSFAWNRLAAACFADRESPFVVLAEDHSGVALIPAAINRNGLTFFGEALFDYRDVLSAGSDGPLHAAWVCLAELKLPLEITAVRGPHGSWEMLAPAPYVNAPQALCREIEAETFAAAHPRLGRNLRRLSKLGAELRQYDGAGSERVAWLYRQKARQLDGVADNLFRDPARVDFLVQACRLAPRDCDLFTLETTSGPLAALLTLCDRKVRRFYTIWFDSAWAQFSPGTTLCYEVTRRSLADGLDCDYMTGEQPHKTRLATSMVPLFRITAPAGALAQFAAAESTLAA